MELYVMRHADAVLGGEDAARPLSAKGRVQAERMGEWLAALAVGRPRIVSSPLLRARETAELVAGALGGLAVEETEALACGMLPDEGATLIHEMSGWGDGVMLVGHAPDLGMLISYLLGANESFVEMRKGTVARLSMQRSGFGGALLRWVVSPELIRR